MKKHLNFFCRASLAITALLTFPGHSYAIEYNAGIKVGESFSDFWGKDKLYWASKSYNVAGRTGYLSLSVKFNNYFSLQPEIGYVKKGKQIDFYYNAYTYYGDSVELSNLLWQELLRFEYIEIPVLARLSIPSSLPVKFSFYAGPHMDILYSATKFINDNGTYSWLKINDETNRYDIGLSIGCSCEIPIFHGALILDERASGGFLTTSRISSIERQVNPSARNNDTKNRTAYFMVGYAYKF